MPSFQRHVFVCVNERPAGNPKGCCKSKGAEAVRDDLKKRMAALGLKGTVRANNAGCLDQCSQGVTVVVYPEQVWYGGVTLADVPELLERHVLRGEFVERLMLPDQSHLGGATSAPPLDHPAAQAARDKADGE
jgi:(2Fe-2S) ferredoxin